MIQVAICDDEPEILQELSGAVTDYGTQKDLDLSIDTYSSAKDLEKQTTYGKQYQIYILDMLMPQMNGIEIGQAIRSHDRYYLSDFFHGFRLSGIWRIRPAVSAKTGSRVTVF